MERGATLGAGLSQYESPIGEIEREERLAAGEFGLGRTPVQTAGDHEMNDEPEQVGRACARFAFDADGNAFADAAQLANCVAFDSGDGRVRGAQDKNTV